MQEFSEHWAEAAYTTLGFFWMALWAFILGYAISSMIQVLVTEKRMQANMGKNDTKGVLLGSFFGFISSSCSFAALATTKSLFQKGASFIGSIAFLLASTNLVIELGIVISIFLGWQFVVGEYVGGILLICFSWLLVRIIQPNQLIKSARNRLKDKEGNSVSNDSSLLEKLSSLDNWKKIGRQYGMEWKMVWKDVTVGFTVAGIVAVFVPDAFFETLFIQSDNGNQEFEFLTLLQHTLVAPVAAFLTFIGSMGNIPLAALLFGKGVSFAGVMAFIFSDLVVFPVLRINANYYGWKMSFFLLFLLFTSLVVASLLLHYGFDFFHALPAVQEGKNIMEQNHFKIDYGFYLNCLFLLISTLLIYLGFFTKMKGEHHHHEMASKGDVLEKVLKYAAFSCYVWLVIGIILKVTL